MDTTHFLTSCGGLAVFTAVFADQVGMPIPAPPLLLAAGALAAVGKLDARLAVSMAALGTILADSLWFYLGRKSGARAMHAVSRWARFRHVSVANARNAIARHGLWTLTIAKFLPGTVMPSLAGALGMSVQRFFVFDGLAAVFYAGCYITAGFVFHDQIQQVMVWFDRVCHGVIGLGIVLVVGYVAYKYSLRRRNKRQKRKEHFSEKGSDAYAGISCLNAANPATEE